MSCIFCGRKGEMTDEHLWPKWVRRTLDESEWGKVVPHSVHPHDRPPRGWREPVFNKRLPSVCTPCNTGWMSKVEDAAKGHAEPLVRGEPRVLGLRARHRIATWAYLKVLLCEHLDKSQRLVPPDRYSWFYEHNRQGEPNLPRSAAVFIAAHVGQLYGQYAHRGLAPPDQRFPEIDTFVGTFTARHLVLQVTENLSGKRPVDFVREPLGARRHQQIFPRLRRVRWPLGPPLDDQELTAFAGPLPSQSS